MLYLDIHVVHYIQQFQSTFKDIRRQWQYTIHYDPSKV